MASLVHLAELEPHRVCLIKPSALGDVVHATPVLAALRARWPGAHLAWVVNRGLAGLLTGLAELDEVIPFERSRLGFGPRGWFLAAEFLLALRARKFDLAIDLQGLLRSGVMTAATGAEVRVGLPGAREGSGQFYTHTIEIPYETTHAVDRLLAVARAFGANTDAPRFLVPRSDSDRAWAAQTLADLPRPWLVVNVGARWPTKRWPPERFAAVARRAVAERSASVIAVGAAEDRNAVDALRSALGDGPWRDLCGRTTLAQLAAIAERADVVLSNDTGPLHLAVAAGARVVAVFTCTQPEKTGPYGPHAEVVASQVWCAGSCIKTCTRLDCMTELETGRVWEAVARQIDRSAAIRHLPAA